MPLRNQITSRLSARSVYSKQATTKKTVEKGRGRPKKPLPVSPTKRKSPLKAKAAVKKARGRPKKLPVSLAAKVKSNLRKKSSPKVRKRKSSVTFKTTAEIIENNSSEADLSSEGEETDQLNDEAPEYEVVQNINKPQVSEDENEINEEESSGEEGDVEDILGDEGIKNDEEEDAVSEENESDEKYENMDPDAEDLEENEEELDDSDENVCYSFPEPSSSQSTANTETTNSNEEEITNSDNSKKKKKNKANRSEIQLEEQLSREKKPHGLVGSIKRKLAHENLEKAEEEQRELSSFQPKKKKKKLSRANFSMEDGARSFGSPGCSRVPSFSPERLLNQNRPSTSTFRSPPHPHIDSIDSLIRFNKSVPCGNVAADQAFRWLINPTLPVDFFHNMFEKMPCTVQRDNHKYYKDLFTGNDLNTMLKEHNLEYGVHIDVVKYSKGLRIPVSADGRAYYSNVWEDYKQGFSLRIRNPQAYNKNLWKLCTLLQEYFSSTVGCNIYLTPPKAQGFPPHYDDIDAFIVQVEGRKYWKVYSPRYPEEELARYSSKDFTQNEIGNPILQVCLNAGEMLYIPRGYIHQAVTDSATHSLHLTFSTNQLNTWGDLLLIATSRAVEKAILSDVTFRESISKDYMDHLGSAVSDSKAFKRYELLNKVKDLAKKAMSYIDVDEAADQHSLKFIQSALPPLFSRIEKEHSLHGNGSYWKNGDIRLKGMIDQNTEIQLIKKRVLRLVIGDNNPRLYHTLENLRDPRPATGEEPLATYVEFEMEGVPSYLLLLNRFPDYVKVKDLPIDDPDDKISFATSLYENGLIMTKDPLPREHDEDFDWSTIPDIMPPIKKERT